MIAITTTELERAACLPASGSREQSSRNGPLGQAETSRIEYLEASEITTTRLNSGSTNESL